MSKQITIEQAREAVAECALLDGEIIFAREVRAGCWDHRSDVQVALRGEELQTAAQRAAARKQRRAEIAALVDRNSPWRHP